jgi:hypothetical protein
MQRAARKVVQENERLRHLLAQHGVLNEEVNAYLRSFDQSATSGETEIAVIRVGSISSSSEHPPGPQTPNRMYQYSRNASSTSRHVVEQPFQISQNRPAQLLRARSDIQQINLAEVVNANARGISNTYMNTNANTCASTNACATTNTYATTNSCATTNTCGSTNTCTKSVSLARPTCPPQPKPQTWEPDKPTYAQPAAEDADCPSTADCFCPPPTTPAPQENRSGLEISCEAAATIIAQMRGDGDRISARASLGCKSDEECTIRNSTLMQILDDGR